MRFLILLSVLLLLGCAQPQQEAVIEDKMEELEEKIGEIEESVDVLEEKVEELEEKVEVLENGQLEEAEEEAEEKEKGYAYYTVTVQNAHSNKSLSPGVFVVHRPLVSINYLGKSIPEKLKPLVEDGNHTPFKEYVEGLDGALSVYTIDKSLGPGENASFRIKASTYMPRETYFSGLQKIEGTTDGFALANNIALFTVGNGPKSSTTSASNYDAGTKENDDTATSPQRPVISHTEISKTVMKVIVTPDSE